METNFIRFIQDDKRTTGMKTHIQTQTEIFRPHYPAIVEFTETQLGKCHWTATEIKVEKDVHDILVNFTDAERHGIYTVLKLFTLYEVKAGADYWTGRFMRSFPQHECQAMAAAFGMMELAVHKPFYNKINELLNATDDKFYTDYVENPVLKARMEAIDKIVNQPDDLVSLGAFTLVEGVILYSSFAFLKHFQSLGKNKLLNVVRGINFSVRDENLHATAGAWVFNELSRQEGGTTLFDQSAILDVALLLVEQEEHIIDMIFAKGDIEGIDAEDMKAFVRERANMCLANLSLDMIFSDTNNTISEWFYQGINNYQMNDFFTGQGREYVRAWDETAFIW